MVTSENYTFDVCLSLESYKNKQLSGAMIGSTKIKENRDIRKQYGFAANKGIGYVRTVVNADTLLNCLIHGHAFCNLFKPEKTRKDGSFGSSQKTYQNFAGSYTIGVDIDQTNYESVEEFVSVLTLKPTLYYTSYSNKQEGKGARFRLIYVFDEMIWNKFFFRYVAWQINAMIERDTKERITDDCNLRCTQYFNGTNVDDTSLVVSYGITHNIYSFSDFGASKQGYIEFLENNCYYKTNAHRAEIQALLRNLKREVVNRSVEESVQGNLDSAVQAASVQSQSIFDEGLLNDMMRLSYDEFMKHNRHKYHYFYRVEKPLWVDGLYQLVDDDFFAFTYSYGKRKVLQDGMKRRKTLFLRMCLRRVMKPTATPNEILFNAFEDMHRFFCMDGIDIEKFLQRNVEACFDFSVDEIKELYSDQISHLKEVTKPKRGIIYKHSKASVAETSFEIINHYYQGNLSVEENIKILASHGLKFGKSTLYKFKKQKAVASQTRFVSDDELLSFVDVTLSVRKNLELLKKNNYKVRVQRVVDTLKKKKEEQANSNVDSRLNQCKASKQSSQQQREHNKLFILELGNTSKDSVIQHQSKSINKQESKESKSDFVLLCKMDSETPAAPKSVEDTNSTEEQTFFDTNPNFQQETNYLYSSSVEDFFDGAGSYFE